MFSIKDDKSIHLTRGDVAVIEISATENNGETHMFQTGDVFTILNGSLKIESDVTI